MSYNIKNNTLSFYFLTTFVCLFFSCSSKSEESNRKTEYSVSSSYNNEGDEDNENNSGCKFKDDTYSATVDYNNSETGYSATYTLDVEVQDCQIVQINFPNDGYLDEDHISYADLDEDGNASVDGEDGKII